MEDCLFCKISAGSIPADVVYSDDDLLAFRDISPQAPVHILIIPRRHIPTVNEVRPEHVPVLGKLQLTAAKIARDQGLAESGYRLIMNCQEGAGQSVFHIHMHLLGGRRMSWPPG